MFCSCVVYTIAVAPQYICSYADASLSSEEVTLPSPPPTWGFPGSSVVENPSAIQEMWVRSLGWENALEEGMATHSSILALEIPWTEEPGGLQSMGSQEQLNHHHLLHLLFSLPSFHFRNLGILYFLSCFLEPGKGPMTFSFLKDWW